MKFHIYSFNEKTALYIAVDDGKKEIVQLLLAREEIDINAKYILKKTIINTILTYIIFSLKIFYFSQHLNLLFSFHSKKIVNQISHFFLNRVFFICL